MKNPNGSISRRRRGQRPDMTIVERQKAQRSARLDDSPERQRMNISVSTQFRRGLGKLALATGYTQSKVIEDAVTEYAEKRMLGAVMTRP